MMNPGTLFIIIICSYISNGNNIFEKNPVSYSKGPCQTTERTAGTCVPPVLCTTYVEDLSKSRCKLDKLASDGICCPNSQPNIDTSKVPFEISVPLGARYKNPPVATDVSEKLIKDATKVAGNTLKARDEIENLLNEKGITVKPGTPEFSHHFIQFTSQEAIIAARDAFIGRETSVEVAAKLKLSAVDTAASIPAIRIQSTTLEKNCPTEPECPATKYRKIDGSCNNLRNKNWGRSRRAFNRLMIPKYADGVGKPREASDGSPLPSTRRISDAALKDKPNEFTSISFMLSVWGQFLTHDMVLTPLHRGRNGVGISCCAQEILNDPKLRHPECLPIDVAEDDSFFSKFKGPRSSCMEFVRSLDAKPNECTLSHREQQNQLTAWIDASQVYGSDDATAARLRDSSGGKLKSGKLPNGKEMPPAQTIPGICRSEPASGKFCFDVGDTRSSEQPQLATMHLVWLRQHNNIAEELGNINPGWNNEILYQESRRIVGDIMQHITYNEYLPIVLGRSVMSKVGILLKKDGFSNDYDPNVDGTIMNEFSTAAFRYGHSTVPGSFLLVQDGLKTEERLRDLFLLPYRTNLIDSYIRGGVGQGSQLVDDIVTADVTTMLFRNSTANSPFGLDLAAINMQRGRDHGIPSYNEVRIFCSLNKIQNFKELGQKFTNPNVATVLSRLYKSVDDVDPWVAGISEKPLSFGVIGETLACVVSEQFRRSKVGDRFWYERANAESSLSEAQLMEIKKMSLARVLCDNSDKVATMQPLAFFKPTHWNSAVDCSSTAIPRMSLEPWRNEPVWS